MKLEKEKFAFMITWVTYNSRVSERMVKFGVRGGEPVRLEIEQELIIMDTVRTIVKKDELKILAINICGDHLHSILVCEFEERDRIVSKLKSISARTHNIAMGWTVPEAHQSQQGGMPPCSSAGRRGELLNSNDCICVEPFTPKTQNKSNDCAVPEAHQSQQGGMPPCSSAGRRGEAQSHFWAQKYHWREISSEKYLINAIDYVKNNRINHGLPANQELEKIITDIIIPIDNAFE